MKNREEQLTCQTESIEGIAGDGEVLRWLESRNSLVIPNFPAKHWYSGGWAEMGPQKNSWNSHLGVSHCSWWDVTLICWPMPIFCTYIQIYTVVLCTVCAFGLAGVAVTWDSGTFWLLCQAVPWMTYIILCLWVWGPSHLRFGKILGGHFEKRTSRLLVSWWRNYRCVFLSNHVGFGDHQSILQSGKEFLSSTIFIRQEGRSQQLLFDSEWNRYLQIIQSIWLLDR